MTSLANQMVHFTHNLFYFNNFFFFQKQDIQAQSQSAKCSSSICMTDLTKESYDKNSFISSYEPELSVAENPYYYHVNEMLFQAHVQRLQRLARVMS